MFNPMDLTGKRILVTGASSNIGRACALELAKLGAELVLVGRNETRLHETKDLLTGAGHQILSFDLGRIEEIGSLSTLIHARERKLSGFVHSAGICPLIPLAATSPDFIRKTMLINFEVFVELCRHLTKKMHFNENGGSVVAISSVSAMAGWPGGGAYCASKAALDGYVRVLALELASKCIRANTVCPSNIKTPMLDENGGTSLKSDEERAAAQPLGLGSAEDIAHAVAFLLSDASKFITGTNLIVDGGYLAR